MRQRLAGHCGGGSDSEAGRVLPNHVDMAAAYARVSSERSTFRPRAQQIGATRHTGPWAPPYYPMWPVRQQRPMP